MPYLILSYFLVNLFHIIHCEPTIFSCPTDRSAGALIRKKDMALKGHVRKTLEKTTFIQCSLRCLKEDWCASVNFEIRKGIGKCELNDYGVEDETKVSIEKGEFEKKEGFVYTQLRPAGISGCYQNRCQNGGTCKLNCAGLTPECHCAYGFEGDRCEVDINECSSNPCQNGGTCTDQVNGYSCTCAAGYNGANCQNNINECSSNPCQNGGTCTDQVNGYSCTCAAGYRGTNCEFQDSATCDLYFPSANINNLVHANWSTLSDLSNLTLSFWIKVPPSYDDEVYPFSYATVSETDALNIKIKTSGDADVKIMNDQKTLDFRVVRDNKWQHCCLTWNRVDSPYPGKVLYYRNGLLLDEDKDLSKDDKLLSGGKLIIGQLQGSYGGNFDDEKLMVGNLAGLNIWDRVFSEQDVSNLYNTSCVGIAGGNVVSWSDIIEGQLEGSTTRSCPTTCPSG